MSKVMLPGLPLTSVLASKKALLLNVKESALISISPALPSAPELISLKIALPEPEIKTAPSALTMTFPALPIPPAVSVSSFVPCTAVIS